MMTLFDTFSEVPFTEGDLVMRAACLKTQAPPHKRHKPIRETRKQGRSNGWGAWGTWKWHEILPGPQKRSHVYLRPNADSNKVRDAFSGPGCRCGSYGALRPRRHFNQVQPPDVLELDSFSSLHSTALLLLVAAPEMSRPP